jgi:hypothetical protein
VQFCIAILKAKTNQMKSSQVESSQWSQVKLSQIKWGQVNRGKIDLKFVALHEKKIQNQIQFFEEAHSLAFN